jgi:hypothetical protein
MQRASSRLGVLWSQTAIPLILPASLAIVVASIGWRGSDLPAQIYRAGLIRNYGISLWDSQWYGGHSTLNYSVLTPVLGAFVGPFVLAAVGGVAGAFVFDRIVRHELGDAGRVGVVWFAVGTVTNLMVGRTAFAIGVALALLVVFFMQRDHPVAAVVAASACSLSSPVAGLFVAVAATAWMATHASRRIATAGVVVAAIGPILLVSTLFPDSGTFPYTPAQFTRDMAACVVVLAILGKRHRVVTLGVVMYVAVSVAAFVVASPLGGNVSRLGQYFAGPIVAIVLWPRRKAVLLACAVPLVIWQWYPVVDGGSLVRSDLSAQSGYYDGLIGFLTDPAHSVGRVEIPFTEHHWETAMVAPVVPMARGWERQLDIKYNALFYDGTLTRETYRAWLADTGVQYVALPDATLDFASVNEAQLLAAGAPYLTVAWRDAHWTVWRFNGYRGIATGPGSVTTLDPSGFTVTVTSAGDIDVKVRPSSHWSVDTTGCVEPDGHGWIVLKGLPAGSSRVTQALVGSSC